ncbi:hypothetical protein QFC19_002270 [Naganishia cerealis]|uniref:Uncharacterized protein n=1 Tax=Naganishia cerealis TaxID=610337 RepID=A0ACC2WBH7_9TREE|nr:hypothetical protein QFC19_002270 [Naganishia cerealis]
MESPTRMPVSIRSDYDHRQHMPAQSSPLRAVFGPKSSTRSSHISASRRKESPRSSRSVGSEMEPLRSAGTPFALTIPPLPPSSVRSSRSRKSATPQPKKATLAVNDENTPLPTVSAANRRAKKAAVVSTSVKRSLAVSAGDQTVFAPSLLGTGDESLLMDQQLPTYKDLWSGAVEDGEDDFGSFLMDSPQSLVITVLNGSVKDKGGKGRNRKSILGESSMGNTVSDMQSATKLHDKSTSKLASRYKPTPKPDSSSRRRSTLFPNIQTESAEQNANSWKSDGQDMMVPLYAPSSPMALGMESTPMGTHLAGFPSLEDGKGKTTRVWQNIGASDIEDLHSDEELGIAEEEVPEEDHPPLASQAVASQSSAAFASQSIPNLPQSQSHALAATTATSSRATTERRKSPGKLLPQTAPMPSSPVSHRVASKKRTPSQRPESGNTPTRPGSTIPANPKDSPNPRVKKSARKSTKKSFIPTVLETAPPSSPAVPLAVDTLKQRMSMGHDMRPTSPVHPKSRRRSKAASVQPNQASGSIPRISGAKERRASISQKPAAKERRLSGRKSTGSIPATQVIAGGSRRARHSLSTSTVAPSKGRRRPRQSLAPLELVERVGLLDIPQRPASPTEDPLLLIPSARRSVGSSRKSTRASAPTTEETSFDSPRDETISGVEVSLFAKLHIDNQNADTVCLCFALWMNQNSTASRGLHANNAVVDQVAEDSTQPETAEGTKYAHESSSFVAPLSPAPRASDHALTAGLLQPSVPGSSPWVAANLSIFSPAAMQSSPVQHSPIRWRIASPSAQPKLQVRAEVPLAEDVAQSDTQQTAGSIPILGTNSLPGNIEDNHSASDEESPGIAIAAKSVVEQEYGDAEGNYMPDGEWQNYEREDSPLSSHDGEVETTGEIAAESEEMASHLRSDPDSQEDQSGEDYENDRNIVPNSLRSDVQPTITAGIQLVPLASLSLVATSPVLKATPKKKRIGRICIRLPLDPIIVKLEPAEEYPQEGEEAVETQRHESATGAHSSHEQEVEDHGSGNETGEQAQVQHEQPGEQQQQQQQNRQDEQQHAEHEQEQAPSSPQKKESVRSELSEEISSTGPRSQIGASVPTSLHPSIPISTMAPQLAELSVNRPSSSIVLSGQDESTVFPSPSPRATATAVLRAESPFLKATSIALESNTASTEVPPAKHVFRESVSSVSVSSEDPRAAARAAALLKLHHRYLNEGPINDSPPTSGSASSTRNVMVSPAKRRISQYFHTAEEASSLTLPELLQEAELELVDTSAAIDAALPESLPQISSTVYSPFPMPGSWSAINSSLHNAQRLQKGRVDFSQWEIKDWKDLERSYKRIYKQKVKTGGRDRDSWNFQDSTEVINHLCKSRRIAPVNLCEEWTSETLRLRINTLHRKRKAKDTLVSDLAITGTTLSRSPKRQKANGGSFVERPAQEASTSTSKRFIHLISRGWRSVLQLVDAQEKPDSAELNQRQRKASHSDADRLQDTSTTTQFPESRNAIPSEQVADRSEVNAERDPSQVQATLERPSTPLQTIEPAPVIKNQPTELQLANRPRGSVLARAEILNSALKGTPAVPSIDLQPSRSSSVSSNRPRVIPDASSFRPMISLSRRSLISQAQSPSVRNIIQSFEKSFEADESTSFERDGSPIVHELHRLSSRRSVSGRASLRETLERSIRGGAKSDP